MQFYKAISSISDEIALIKEISRKKATPPQDIIPP